MTRGVAVLAIIAAVGFAAGVAELPVRPPAVTTAGAQTGAPTVPSKAPAKKEKDGKWTLPDGTPTFNIAPDGTVDWFTYSGYRRYHSECHVCHGPDGEGSTYAPALVQSMKTMSYDDFMLVVASGRQNVGSGKESVMPALGDNPNVMCYIDDIYVYLKARAEGGLPRGRPLKRADKPAAADQHERACFGQK